jgi:hypothetical protein
VTIQFGSNPPRRCHHDDNISNWCEVKDEPTTKSSQLLKLTAEVFDRPDCPNWARYAVINHNGRLSFFGDKPKFEGEDYGCWSCDDYRYTHINNAFFDPSDWQNSLIERPAKEKALPDWCKVGNWVYYIPLIEYCKIEQMNEGFMLRFVDGDSTAIPLEDVNNLAQVNQRPFNEKEMQGLVGKMLDTSSSIELIVCYDKYAGDIITHDDTYSAERLMSATDWRIDGKPCFKLEHLNDKGEWVE